MAPPPLEIEGKTDVVEGVFHIERHSGYKNLKKPHFKAVDDILWDQIEQVAKRFGFGDSSEKPHDSLKRALSQNVGWDEIEQEFTQSNFWKRDGEPTSKRDDFTAHKGGGKLNTFRVILRLKSREEFLKEQKQKTPGYIPRAKSWFEKLIDDPDIRQCLQLDMEKVWDEIVALRDLPLDPNDTSAASSQGRNQYGLLEKRFLDIGIISFPDFQEPRVKVFRLKLTVWSLFTISDLRSGIRGDLTTTTYRPREECMEVIKDVVEQMQRPGPTKCWRMILKGHHEAIAVSSIECTAPASEAIPRHT